MDKKKSGLTTHPVLKSKRGRQIPAGSIAKKAGNGTKVTARKVSGKAKSRPTASKEGAARQQSKNRSFPFVGIGASAGVLINDAMEILQFRGYTAPYLGPAPGTASLNLLKMIHTDLLLELRTAIHKARKGNVSVRKEGLEVKYNGQFRQVTIEVIPIKPSSSREYFFLIFFEDMTPTAKPESKEIKPDGIKPGKAKKAEDRQLVQLKQELAAAKEYLQSIIEEQEVTNEELKSAGEEILSSNEELQSTNEELETSKEELQSANEELTTLNEELQNRNLELNQLNNDLMNLFSSVQIPIVILGNDLCIRRFTPMAEKAMNLSPTDIGRPISEIKLNIDVPDLEPLLVEVINTVSIKEREIQDRAGRWYSLHLQPYKMAENRIDGAVMVLIDIDAIKRSMAQIEEALQYAEAIIETVREPLLVLDANLRVKTANRSFYQTFKCSPRETENNFIYDLGNGQWNIPALRTLLEKTLPKNSRFQDLKVEHKFRTVGRKIMLLNARQIRHKGTHPRMILLAIEDITERMQAERELRTSEVRYRRLFEAARDGVLILDPDTRKITDVNPFMMELLGFSHDEFLGKELWEIGLLKDEKDSQEAFRELQVKGYIRYEDLPLVTKEGKHREVEVVSNLYKEDGQSVIQYNIRDITERKEAEMERIQLLDREQAARTEAEAANRAKDEFLATVSHELRTPLTAILGWARMLSSGKLDEAAVARAIETIERNAKAQAKLIEDLLDISRVIAGKLSLDLRMLDMLPITKAAIDTVRPTADAKAIRINSLLDPSVGQVLGDPMRLQQVVWNLLSNAVKFTPKGGSIEVRLERIESQVKITVSDAGKGISPEFLPYVFDRFRQADSTSQRLHGGIGLGLAIARHLVELHKGTVHAESQGEGQGATFTVNLPLIAIGPEAGDLQQSYSTVKSSLLFDNPSILKGLQVLVVDDEVDTLEMLAIVLEKSGAEVIAVTSSAEALEALERTMPDVLVSDIAMPVEDGYALIRKVRALRLEQGGQIPAAALTAYAKPEDRVQAFSAGFQQYIAKPVEPGELVMMVANLTGRIGITTQRDAEGF